MQRGGAHFSEINLKPFLQITKKFELPKISVFWVKLNSLRRRMLPIERKSDIMAATVRLVVERKDRQNKMLALLCTFLA